jgi:hypothetical protein
MTTHDRKTARSHDDVLEQIAAALDIPSSLFEEAKARYESLGAWLDREGSSLAAYDPAISPQGSFLLGTVTRPLTEADEYDVDLVCVLKGTKAEFTQKSLKEAVGSEVALYARVHNMSRPPEEGRRCWTVTYADGAQFHMDILPALPDSESYRLLLEQHGYRALAHNPALSGQAIAITDNTSPDYARRTEDWPQSNPQGYAAWFRSRMITQLRERKRALVEALRIMAKVDDIPDYKVKTPLQRTIQLLKRHRDVMFAEDDEHKPISIVITTLSAHAYNNEPTIALALQSILTRMDHFIEYPNDEAWVANPVNPAENFADKWGEEPLKRENFYHWLEKARRDFALYLRASAFEDLPVQLKESLGSDLVDRVLDTVFPAATGLAAPAIARGADQDGAHRAEAAIAERQRAGSQSKPWAKS